MNFNSRILRYLLYCVLAVGSCIIQLKEEKFPIHMVGWRGNCSLRAYIAVPDSVHYLRILGEDVSVFGE